MKTRGLVLSFAITAGLCLSIANALAKTASCPCSPCKCSPCTCGGGGKSGGGKHHGKEHRRDHGSSVGVGVDVDLSGVGHRNAEPDPFAVGGGEKPAAHTEEKRTTKHKEKEPTSSSFDEIKLTGNEAKEVDENPSQPPSGGSTTVSDNEVKTNDSPAPETKEKPKAKKPKPTWPKPIQDWLDARAAVSTAKSNLSNAQGTYYTELHKFYGKSAYHNKLVSAKNEACDKVANAGKAATQADKDACEKARKALGDQEEKLAQDFDNSPEGKKAIADIKDAKKAVTAAEEAEKAAAKDIDEPTQKKVLKKMDKWYKDAAAAD
jgi:hypothetical protein